MSTTASFLSSLSLSFHPFSFYHTRCSMFKSYIILFPSFFLLLLLINWWGGGGGGGEWVNRDTLRGGNMDSEMELVHCSSIIYFLLFTLFLFFLLFIFQCAKTCKKHTLEQSIIPSHGTLYHQTQQAHKPISTYPHNSHVGITSLLLRPCIISKNERIS